MPVACFRSHSESFCPFPKTATRGCCQTIFFSKSRERFRDLNPVLCKGQIALYPGLKFDTDVSDFAFMFDGESHDITDSVLIEYA